MNENELTTQAILLIPEKIKGIEIEMIKKMNESAEIIQQIEIIETGLKAQTYSNPEYKNDTVRRAKYEQILAENHEHDHFSQEKKKLDEATNMLRIELEYQKRLFQGYIAIAGMKS